MIRTLNAMALAVAFLLAAALYVVKNDVKYAQERLANLQMEVVQAREAVLLLEKEEAYLESPARLASLAQTHLGLVPMSQMAARDPSAALKQLQAEAPTSLAGASMASLPLVGE